MLNNIEKSRISAKYHRKQYRPLFRRKNIEKEKRAN